MSSPVTKSGWVIASQRSPPQKFPILIFTKAGYMHVAHWVEKEGEPNGGFCVATYNHEAETCDMLLVTVNSVTHWQPCPARPHSPKHTGGE